ncbi:amino acid ABC transporter ATP-binding protein [bacterium]|nr:amino acid ABC transporter ATP-binding protein [bacterium]
MIEVRDLEKRYEGAKEPVLKGVSFSLETGALAAILGSSGAGKTTLLRCLVGLEAFDSGKITVDGVEVLGQDRLPGKSARAEALRQLRSRVGLVFQSFELFPHLSVLENLTLAPVLVKGLSRNVAEDRAHVLLKQVGLAEKGSAYPDHLSGGQKQRVAIARALAVEPRVLLYDEPTSALDPSLKHEIAETLRGLKPTGITQIVVTHDVPIAREAAEIVFVLDRGRIVESGPPSSVLDNPREEATRRLLGPSKSNGGGA